MFNTYTNLWRKRQKNHLVKQGDKNYSQRQQSYMAISKLDRFIIHVFLPTTFPTFHTKQGI